MGYTSVGGGIITKISLNKEADYQAAFNRFKENILYVFLYIKRSYTCNKVSIAIEKNRGPVSCSFFLPLFFT